MFHSLSKFCANLLLPCLDWAVILRSRKSRKINILPTPVLFSAPGLPFCALTLFVGVLVRTWGERRQAAW
jgi:hypothetical protein